MKRIAFAVTGILLMLPPVAIARQDGRLAVAGTVEYARITEDEGFLGAGIGGSGTLQWRLTDATSLEVEVGRERHVRDLDSFAVAFGAQGHPVPLPYLERWEGTATFVIGLVSHAFGTGRARPVVWGGGGLMSHGGTTRGPLTMPDVPAGFVLQPGDMETFQGRKGTSPVLDAGGGIDVRVTERITIRPFAGLRLANTNNFGPKYIIRSGIRVGFNW